VPRWTDAIRDGQQLKNAGKDAGPKLIVPVLVVAGGVMFIVPQTRPFAMKVLETAKNTLSKAP
jgi:membrane protein CcdC involved in cytochrome C biogenesis